ncbi:alpha/beta-hydrolase [Thozetella sp. PMI_491]|nr:alpha/beta-hydrolase [Thozetella sp. PMI_491]
MESLTGPREDLTPAEDVINHPAFATAVWDLEPAREGKAVVARGRQGGPLNIYWQIHGGGPIRILLICGIAARHTAWQRQTLHFGHINGDKYSVLLVDNRGSGNSDKPFRYSTSEMAMDLVEVLDHVGWAEDRQIHVVGLSLGGMIAQELAMLIPERMSTLNLIHTAAHIEATWWENIVNYSGLLKPRTLDQSLAAAAMSMFSHEWLLAPDDAAVPQKGMPGVKMPPGGKYLMFETNFQRYAAQEIRKQRMPNYGEGDKWGILGHFIASSCHNKTDAQLREISEKVGRERILVIHTKEDGMIPCRYGQKLVEVLQPGSGLILEGQGHVPKLEKAKWFNKLLEGSFAKGEALTRARET